MHYLIVCALALAAFPCFVLAAEEGDTASDTIAESAAEKPTEQEKAPPAAAAKPERLGRLAPAGGTSDPTVSPVDYTNQMLGEIGVLQ
jgi:hypothetical protein